MNTDRQRLLPPKSQVFGIRTVRQAVAISRSALQEQIIVRHSQDGEHLLAIYDPELGTAWAYQGAEQAVADLADTLTLQDITFTRDGPQFTGRNDLKEVIGIDGFWFAWYAFYPGTTLIR